MADRSRITFDVELSSDLFSPEACANFGAMFSNGQGPWQLSPGEFGSCYVSSGDSESKQGSLDHWKFLVQTKGKKLIAAICRPLPRQNSLKQKCYSEISVFSNANYFDVFKDSRFIVQLTAALYENAPVASYSVAEQVPGSFDNRLPVQLASPPELQPIQLIYINNGDLFKRVEIDRMQISEFYGKKVFWTKTRSSPSRRNRFISELEYFLRSVFKKSQSSLPSLGHVNSEDSDVSLDGNVVRNGPTQSLPLNTENLSQAAKAADLAKENSQRAAADARAAAERAAAARALAEQQQAVANAALRDAEAKKLAAREAQKKEEVARKIADEELVKREALAKEAAAREREKKASAAREALLNAKKARGVAEKAEADARAALEAASLPSSSSDKQPLLKDKGLSSKTSPNPDLNSSSSVSHGSIRGMQHFVIMVAGFPIQQKYRERLPAVFSLGLENELWSLETFKFGVWANFERIYFNQSFKPDVISDSVQDSLLVQSVVARGERTESQWGIFFDNHIELGGYIVLPSFRIASNQFSSVLSYDRSQLNQEPGKIDGTSTIAGVSLGLEPALETNGFIVKSSLDFLFGRIISGKRLSQVVGWRIFENQEVFNADVFLDFQNLSVISRREIDDGELGFRTNRLSVGLKFHLF